MKRYLSSAEAQVLEALLPEGLTETMREVALCLFMPLALQDSRAGQCCPDDAWRAVLTAMARAVLLQLDSLAAHMGGQPIYLAKGMAVGLNARDRRLCSEFRGNNYPELARRYRLTEMRVRQIVAAWQQEQFQARQAGLPGLEQRTNC